jgi:hypothetical protein
MARGGSAIIGASKIGLVRRRREFGGTHRTAP